MNLSYCLDIACASCSGYMFHNTTKLGWHLFSCTHSPVVNITLAIFIKASVGRIPGMSEKQQGKVWPEEGDPSGEISGHLDPGGGETQTTGPLGHEENTEFVLNVMESIRRFEQRMMCTDYHVKKIEFLSVYRLDYMRARVEPTSPGKTQDSRYRPVFVSLLTLSTLMIQGTLVLLCFSLDDINLETMPIHKIVQQKETRSSRSRQERLWSPRVTERIISVYSSLFQLPSLMRCRWSECSGVPRKTKSRSIAFADFHGVNNSILANFKLPTDATESELESDGHNFPLAAVSRELAPAHHRCMR